MKRSLSIAFLMGMACPALFCFQGCQTNDVAPRASAPAQVEDSGPALPKAPKTSLAEDTLPDLESIEKTYPIPPDSPMNALDKEDIIQVGDKLSYSIAEESEKPRIILVDETGSIYLPLLGSVRAQGKTPYELSRQLQVELQKEYYSKATVLVTDFKNAHSRGQVYILGQVVKQGEMEIPSDRVFTVSRAILAAGGFNERADATRVTLIRKDSKDPNKEQKFDINVSEILNNGRLDLDVPVRADDFIFIPSQGDTIGESLVTGAVRNPGSYPIPIGIKYTVSQAIFRAGGFDEFADQDSVKIIRHKPGTPEEERTITVNVEKVMEDGRRDLDVQLYPDDVVVVPERWFNF